MKATIRLKTVGSNGAEYTGTEILLEYADFSVDTNEISDEGNGPVVISCYNKRGVIESSSADIHIVRELTINNKNLLYIDIESSKEEMEEQAASLNEVSQDKTPGPFGPPLIQPSR